MRLIQGCACSICAVCVQYVCDNRKVCAALLPWLVSCVCPWTSPNCVFNRLMVSSARLRCVSLALVMVCNALREGTRKKGRERGGERRGEREKKGRGGEEMVCNALRRCVRDGGM